MFSSVTALYIQVVKTIGPSSRQVTAVDNLLLERGPGDSALAVLRSQNPGAGVELHLGRFRPAGSQKGGYGPPWGRLGPLWLVPDQTRAGQPGPQRAWGGHPGRFRRALLAASNLPPGRPQAAQILTQLAAVLVHVHQD